jgi:hypothetical protein
MATTQIVSFAIWAAASDPGPGMARPGGAMPGLVTSQHFETTVMRDARVDLPPGARRSAPMLCPLPQLEVDRDSQKLRGLPAAAPRRAPAPRTVASRV